MQSGSKGTDEDNEFLCGFCQSWCSQSVRLLSHSVAYQVVAPVGGTPIEDSLLVARNRRFPYSGDHPGSNGSLMRGDATRSEVMVNLIPNMGCKFQNPNKDTELVLEMCGHDGCDIDMAWRCGREGYHHNSMWCWDHQFGNG